LAARAVGWLRLGGAALQRRPRRTALALALLALAGAGGGFYLYALHEWQVAVAYLKDDLAGDAQAALKPCLLLWPYSTRVHLLAARACRLKGDFGGAESHLNECLRLDPGAKEDIQLEFLLMRVQNGEEDVVAPDLEAYVDKKHPESGMILETLARAYMTQLRYGPALGVLDRWIREDPNAAKAYKLRGWVWMRIDDTQSAMNDYQRAVELDPDGIGARLQLAEMDLDRFKTAEAWPHLQILYRKAPDLPGVQDLMGRYYFLEGHGDKARPFLEAAAKKMPDDAELLITLAKLDLQEGHAAKAEEWVRHALAVDPTDAEARYALVSVLQAEGRDKEADAELAQYQRDAALLLKADKLLKDEVNNPTNDPVAYFQIGALFLRGGQKRIGEFYLQKALDLAPDCQPALKELADYYEGQGDSKQAEYYRRRLKAAKPQGAAP
jgi:Tfp pilus assembly protein PilF